MEKLDFDNKFVSDISNNSRDDCLNLIRNMHLYFIHDIGNINEEEKNVLNDYYEFIYLIILDVCRNEDVNINDIELIGNGAFSVALGIGNKVLKVGAERITDTFPNNPYVVPMLLRKRFIINDNIGLFVEVTERCDNNIKITDSEIIEFRDKLESIDIFWGDAGIHNLGRVTNKEGNVISWKENLYVSDEVLGLTPYRGDEILKQGDLVIIDNDCLYDDRDDLFLIKKSKSR